MINFNIKKVRYFSYIISFLLLASFITGIFYKSQIRETIFLYSIEFTGGYQVSCELKKLDKSITAEDIKNTLEKNNYNGCSIRQFEKNTFLIRFSSFQDKKHINNKDLENNIKKIISKIESNVEVIIHDTSFVGPSVGKELGKKGLISIVLSLLLMFIYMWSRFPSWKFAFANIISLIHDILVILTFLLWTNTDISLDALIAILFIIGYSINDTIVIFAAIRNNMRRKNVESPDSEIINTSIKKTLKRTLLTSFFTSLVVFPLWIFGGKVLADLAIPILLGIIFGTYSSIAVACTALYNLFSSSKNN